MHLKPPTDMKVIKKQEKAERLTAFIRADLKTRVNTDSTKPHVYLLIARSLESPVARSLAALSKELQKARVTLKVILSGIDDPKPLEATIDANVLAPAEIRITEDNRLFDAHEQLVLSDTRAWVGDIMRREPAKRDAYETYSENCASTALWGRLAFERIWAASTGKPAQQSSATNNDVGPSELAALTAEASSADTADKAIIAGTRH